MASVATSNPESHSHLSLMDVVTVTFNMAVTMKIMVLAGLHIDRTFNGARKTALGAIEGEIPTTTAAVACINPEVTSKIYMEGSVCEVLHKFAVPDQSLVFAISMFPGAFFPVHVRGKLR